MKCSLLVLITFVTAASPAGADDARTLKQDGLAAAQAKNWELARKKFEESYAIDPDPFTLYNLAAAQEHTDHLVAARESYAKFLAQTKPTQGKQFRAAAKKQLPILEQAIPTLQIKVIGFSATAIVELDGRSLVSNELSTRFPLDPGHHVIVARQDTNVLAREEIDLARGARQELTLTAPPPKIDKPPPPPPPPVIVRQPPPPPPPPEQERKHGALRSGWFWTATSVVLVGAAGAYYFLYYDQRDPTQGTLGRGVIDL